MKYNKTQSNNWPFKLETFINLKQTTSFKNGISKIQDFRNFELSPVIMIDNGYLAPRLYFFSCSAQPSTKFQLLIKAKILTNKKFLASSLSDVVFIMLINFKMPTIVGILTFMSRINFVLR